MLTENRTDEIPSHANPRNVRVVENLKHKSKDVWANVKDKDNEERDLALGTNDCKAIQFDGLDADKVEIEKT